jgi:hypothetical protein
MAVLSSVLRSLGLIFAMWLLRSPLYKWFRFREALQSVHRASLPDVKHVAVTPSVEYDEADEYVKRSNTGGGECEVYAVGHPRAGAFTMLNPNGGAQFASNSLGVWS